MSSRDRAYLEGRLDLREERDLSASQSEKNKTRFDSETKKLTKFYQHQHFDCRQYILSRKGSFSKPSFEAQTQGKVFFHKYCKIV